MRVCIVRSVGRSQVIVGQMNIYIYIYKRSLISQERERDIRTNNNSSESPGEREFLSISPSLVFSLFPSTKAEVVTVVRSFFLFFLSSFPPLLHRVLTALRLGAVRLWRGRTHAAVPSINGPNRRNHFERLVLIDGVVAVVVDEADEGDLTFNERKKKQP